MPPSGPSDTFYVALVIFVLSILTILGMVLWSFNK